MCGSTDQQNMGWFIFRVSKVTASTKKPCLKRRNSSPLVFDLELPQHARLLFPALVYSFNVTGFDDRNTWGGGEGVRLKPDCLHYKVVSLLPPHQGLWQLIRSLCKSINTSVCLALLCSGPHKLVKHLCHYLFFVFKTSFEGAYNDNTFKKILNGTAQVWKQFQMKKHLCILKKKGEKESHCGLRFPILALPAVCMWICFQRFFWDSKKSPQKSPPSTHLKWPCVGERGRQLL